MPKIRIAGQDLEVPAPYAEGYTLSANEAQALNGLLGENLRNNFAAKVKAEVEAAEKEGREPNIQGLQSQLTEYANSYQFGVRRSGNGGGGGLPADPVEREATKMAREMVRQALKSRNVKAEQEQVNQLAQQYLEQNADIRKEAKRRVNATRSIASTAVDLGSIGLASGGADAQPQPDETA